MYISRNNLKSKKPDNLKLKRRKDGYEYL